MKYFKYIYSIQGAAMALVAFSLAAIFIPGNGPAADVELILTVSSFLFAILAGFFISRLNSRFDRVRDSVAGEDANWISFYKTAKIVDPKLAAKAADLMDDYYIAAYDFEVIGDYYNNTAIYYHRVYDLMGRYKNQDFKSQQLFDDMVILLNNIEDCRNRASVVSVEKLTYGQWTVLFSLASIIVYSIFYLKTDAIPSQIVSVMLSTVLVLVILIMRDFQNMRLSGQSPLGESGQEVLEFIGKKRYYNKCHLDSGFNKVPNDVREYRVGTHVPGAKKFNIKLVKNV